MTDKKISELPAISSINSANELPIVDTGVSKKVSITQLLEFISPDATTAIKGKVELATDSETQTGTDAVRAVTPAGMASVVSSETLRGLIELATSAEVITGTDTARAVTPAGLAGKLSAVVVPASTTVSGIVELATDAETITGTDATRAVTPASLAAKVSSTTAQGLVELATSAEVITGTDATRVITPSTLRGGVLVSSAVVNTTSGTFHDIPNIPSWAKRITLSFSGVSTNGTSDIIIQLGVSGTPETTGYLGTCWVTTLANNFTNGIMISSYVNIGNIFHGRLTMDLLDPSTNTWAFDGHLGLSSAAAERECAGSKSLAGVLNMLRLTTAGGANTFDAGKFSAIWE